MLLCVYRCFLYVISIRDSFMSLSDSLVFLILLLIFRFIREGAIYIRDPYLSPTPLAKLEYFAHFLDLRRLQLKICLYRRYKNGRGSFRC